MIFLRVTSFLFILVFCCPFISEDNNNQINLGLFKSCKMDYIHDVSDLFGLEMWISWVIVRLNVNLITLIALRRDTLGLFLGFVGDACKPPFVSLHALVA